VVGNNRSELILMDSRGTLQNPFRLVLRAGLIPRLPAALVAPALTPDTLSLRCVAVREQMVMGRRFPPSWSVEEQDACYLNKQKF
jgi:hypothetical protein